jgi:hypothetical protein
VVAASTRTGFICPVVIIFTIDTDWLGANIGLNIIFARPERRDGFYGGFEEPSENKI